MDMDDGIGWHNCLWNFALDFYSLLKGFDQIVSGIVWWWRVTVQPAQRGSEYPLQDSNFFLNSQRLSLCNEIHVKDIKCWVGHRGKVGSEAGWILDKSPG